MNAKARKKLLSSLGPAALMAAALIALCALAQALSGGSADQTVPERNGVINEVMSKNAYALERARLAGVEALVIREEDELQKALEVVLGAPAENAA